MKKIRIGYFADGPWSHQALDLILRDPLIEVAFIVPRIDTKDEFLKNSSEENEIDYLSQVKVNSIEFIAKSRSYECDLFVSMSFDQIFRKEIINVPKLKTINCHAGKLPFYRGRNILNWALINDEKEFGITVHYVDEGVDTGDIILQRCFRITDNDTYNTLLNVAYIECATILYDAIKLIQNDNVLPVRQNTLHTTGFYCGKRGPGDEVINWCQNSRELFNFIRSICEPGPMATTYYNELEIKINKSRIIEDAPTYKGKPGQILSKTERGYMVKTLDSFIEIFEIITVAKLKIGDVLK